MSKTSLNDLAKGEFSTLNKSKFKKFNKVEVPNIYILCSNSEVTQNIKETAEDLHYNVVGISDNGEKGIKEAVESNTHLIFISLNLNGKISGVSAGQFISKFNIPIIYIFEDSLDVDSNNFLMTNYGFIFERYSKSEIKFAMEVALRKYFHNVKSVEHVESKHKEKNVELGMEKAFSVVVFAVSVVLLILGLMAKNLTFIQWIIFIPSIFMLIGAILSLKTPDPAVPFKEPPFVSIFIPAHNEENTIETTVRSIAGMEYNDNEGNCNYEVIVVNDGSTDSTGEILTRLKNEIPHVRLITRRPPKSGKGKGFVLNDGLILAKGSIVGVFDADTRVEKQYLNKIIPYLNDPKVDGVQSRVQMYNYDENYLARMQDVEFCVFATMLTANDVSGYNAFLGGNGQFVKKESIEKAGKWDGFAVTEDLNLSVKISLNGGSVRFCPETTIFQEAVTSWKSYFRQRVRWAMGNLETLSVYSTRILFAKMPLMRKVNTLFHMMNFLIYAFVFISFLAFIANAVAWYVFDIPTLLRMDAPLIVGVISALAFFPPVIISLIRGNRKFVRGVAEFIGYWFYCFAMIPLFFDTMVTIILRRERKWEKTAHKGDKQNAK